MVEYNYFVSKVKKAKRITANTVRSESKRQNTWEYGLIRDLNGTHASRTQPKKQMQKAVQEKLAISFNRLVLHNKGRVLRFDNPWTDSGRDLIDI